MEGRIYGYCKMRRLHRYTNLKGLIFIEAVVLGEWVFWIGWVDVGCAQIMGWCVWWRVAGELLVGELFDDESYGLCFTFC